MKVHLFGDSILSGLVTDLVENPAESLADLRTPAAIMNLAAGRPVAAFSGWTRLPKNVDQAARELTALLNAGVVASGDAIVFLDVGPHAMDTRRHEEDWYSLRRAAVAAHDVRLLMCSGFDHGARGRVEYMHEAPLDGRSPNDAVRAAALRPGAFVGRTEFLDVAFPLARLHWRMRDRFGLSPYFRDCVHLTAWGQIGLCLLILKTLKVPIRGLGGLAETVVANRRHLGVGAESDALEVLRFVAANMKAPAALLSLDLAQARARRTVRRTVRRLFGRPAPRSSAAAPDVAGLLDRAAALSDPHEALDVYRHAAALAPTSAEVQQGRLRAAALAGDSDEVIQAGRVALALDPVGGKYYVWIAQAMLQERSPPELVGWFERLAELHAPPRAYRAIAELVDALGEPGRREVWAERLAQVPAKALR